jgi:tetraacyldisaccharide 4'-kinase
VEAWFSRVWWQIPAPAAAQLLRPWAEVYRLLLWAKQLAHHARRTQPQPLPVPVLVVGNLVVGGAGKTPTVIAVVQALQRAGHRPGVISRGHGRAGGPPGQQVLAVQHNTPVHLAGDEPLLIQRRCGVPVWVGAQRAEVAAALCQAHPEVDVLVSDDGLQHHALARRAELVVFDERGTGNGLLLPAGPLRQPLPLALPATSRVLYTAGQPSTALPGSLAQRSIHSAWPLAAWHRGEAGQAVPLAALKGQPLLAAAGLAAPEKFFSMLQSAGLDFQRLALPDHHAYSCPGHPTQRPSSRPRKTRSSWTHNKPAPRPFGWCR